MEKPLNISDVIASHLVQNKSVHELTADLDAIVIELQREKKHAGKQTARVAELSKMAVIQERLILRVLDRTRNKSARPKAPHLKVIK